MPDLRMTSVEPSQFYTGIVAQIYAPLRSVVPEAEPYMRFITRSGEPALELGCGDGDPLLELRELGIDVEGLDSSADMLDRCRAAALVRGVEVTLHEQSMESISIGRHFRSIFIAGPTFNLLPDDGVALRALQGIAAHLAEGGAALIPLFVPAPSPRSVFGVPRLHVCDDGSEMSFTLISETRDDVARTQTAHTRYELSTAAGTQVAERDWLLHWYRDARFRELVESAQLVVKSFRTQAGAPANADDDAVVYILAKR